MVYTEGIKYKCNLLAPFEEIFSAKTDPKMEFCLNVALSQRGGKSPCIYDTFSFDQNNTQYYNSTRGFSNPSHHMGDLMFETGGAMQGKYPKEGKGLARSPLKAWVQAPMEDQVAKPPVPRYLQN